MSGLHWVTGKQARLRWRSTAGRRRAFEAVRRSQAAISTAVCWSTAAATLLAAGNASAAQEVAQLAGSDNRVGIIATLFLPVVGWVCLAARASCYSVFSECTGACTDSCLCAMLGARRRAHRDYNGHGKGNQQLSHCARWATTSPAPL